ncbi:hypothetical protein [Salinibacterium sp. SWN1162]|uniref:hypothetical protein n=1 Tax=Salinibacterium sp. SWN1162 TaxID=2792053 RepID=UPI001E5BB9B7|nr:hypothetical protein [Salinibacterium sp. SWN1162]
MPSPITFHAFADESSANRGESQQEYLIGAALVPVDECEDVRERLRPLLLPGQIKLHWTDESESRRRRIIALLCELGTMNVVIAHRSTRQKKTERFRRKCLGDFYSEMTAMNVQDVTLESRSPKQDKLDRAHIVGLQNSGQSKGVRITHLRGGDEPLLWIADAALGAINADYLGEKSHLEALSHTFVVHRCTSESLTPEEFSSGKNERP